MADESSSSSLSSSIQSGVTNLDECYRHYRESKVTKDNVWTNPFIDQFQHLIGRHHSALGTFHLVGSMIEASSQIYGLKVDCIHSDVLRLASGVRREKIIQPDAGTVDELISSVSSNQSIVPIKRRRVKTTLVGNSQLINAKLETIEEPNCLFKLKGVNPANGVSTKNLLQSVLSSDKYALSVQSKNKFWSDRAAQMNELDDDSAVVNADSVNLPVLNWAPSNTDVVRSRITGYTISNTPSEHFQYPSTTIVDEVNQFDLEDNYNEMSQHSSIDLQFDINGDVERSQEPVRMQPDIMNDSLNTAEDLNALQRCTVLQQNAAITDLRPVTLTPLEYSYRRISSRQLLSGSNHWKFPSMQSNDSKGNKKRRKRKVAAKPVALRSVLKESIAEKFVSVDDPLAQSIRKVCYTKWQSNKLTVPSKMSMPSFQSFAPLIADCLETHNVNLANENVIEMDVDEENGEIDGNGNDDSMSMEDNINLNPHDSNEVDVGGYIHEDVNDLPPLQVSVAPIQQLQAMQISPSNIDVKKISKKCLEIICAYEAEGGVVSYSYVYHQLQINNQDVTPAVVFSCILQLANENNFHLNKIGANDFVIKRI